MIQIDLRSEKFNSIEIDIENLTLRLISKKTTLNIYLPKEVLESLSSD